jgi:F-type H+-transporting ATPase subunit a
MEALEPPVFNTFGLPHHVVFSWLVMLVLIGVGLAAARRPQLVPTGLQNAMEAALEFVLSLIDDVIGPDGRRFLPLIATLGLYIFASNLLGLVPGFTAPTDNLNTTASCAIVVFFSYHWIGIRRHGLGAYLRHFAGPMPALAPLMVPIEVISHFARPLSLTLRLFGNMLGGHILLSIVFFMTVGLSTWALSGAAGWLGWLIGGVGTVVTVAFTVGFLYPLKILVAFLQAFIFVMLSMLYIAGALEAEHDHEPAPHGAAAHGPAAVAPHH